MGLYCHTVKAGGSVTTSTPSLTGETGRPHPVRKKGVPARGEGIRQLMGVTMNQLVNQFEPDTNNPILEALGDQFVGIFGIDSAMKSSAAISDAMFKHVPSTYTVREWTREDKLAFSISQMKKIGTFLGELKDQYEDKRGSLDEAHRMAGEILLNLNGHTNDIKEGIEE